MSTCLQVECRITQQWMWQQAQVSLPMSLQQSLSCTLRLTTAKCCRTKFGWLLRQHSGETMICRNVAPHVCAVTAAGFCMFHPFIAVLPCIVQGPSKQPD